MISHLENHKFGTCRYGSKPKTRLLNKRMSGSVATTLGSESVAAVSPYVQGLLDRMRQAGVDITGSAPTELEKVRNVLGMGNLHIGSQYPGGVGLAAIGPQAYNIDPGSGKMPIRSTNYFGGSSAINTVITKAEAKGIKTSTTPGQTYDASIKLEPKAMGPITTLLDLTTRDQQENDLFPISSEITWFARDTERRIVSFVPAIQEIALRGPAAFGQRFSFDIGSVSVGDILLGTTLQINLGHWLDQQTQNAYEAGFLTYEEIPTAWEYANSLGTSIIQRAELEMDGQTVETIDGDFIFVFSTLFADYNTQFGIAYDHLGILPKRRLTSPTRLPSTFPVEGGTLNCLLPFWFMRTKLQEGLPMIAVKDGSVKIHITLRPFSECVRQMRGYRDSCDATPLSTVTNFTYNACNWIYDSVAKTGYWDLPPKFPIDLSIGTIIYKWDGIEWTSFNGYRWVQDLYPANYTTAQGPFTWSSAVYGADVAAPAFKSVQLLTYGAIVDGELRRRMLRDPFDLIHRELQTFSFDEPLKYAVGWNGTDNRIRIQLPLESNHPVEEIIWFIRRKDARNNNDWTNYSSITERDWVSNPYEQTVYAAKQPLLQTAEIQVNGQTLCKAEEQYYRQHIAAAHRGGYTAYSRFVYGYSFAERPGEHQPSGSLNASRVDSLRLILEVDAPEEGTWEVKAFCLALNWTRFENGLSSPMYMD